jgi:hypothetical protein
MSVLDFDFFLVVINYEANNALDKSTRIGATNLFLSKHLRQSSKIFINVSWQL